MALRLINATEQRICVDQAGYIPIQGHTEYSTTELELPGYRAPRSVKVILGIMDVNLLLTKNVADMP